MGDADDRIVADAHLAARFCEAVNGRLPESLQVDPAALNRSAAKSPPLGRSQWRSAAVAAQPQRPLGRTAALVPALWAVENQLPISTAGDHDHRRDGVRSRLSLAFDKKIVDPGTRTARKNVARRSGRHGQRAYNSPFDAEVHLSICWRWRQ
jgi:hypothetical protein